MWRATTASHAGLKPWTLVTYAFLHGSWTHVGLNCVWIVAFGPPLARRFGPWRFYLFFAVTAACGALLHWLMSPMDFTPLIGASAAASGFMAGAAPIHVPARRPARACLAWALARARRDAGGIAFVEVLTDRRALFFIGIWLVTNMVFGAGARALGAADAPVAWIAHIGGFVGGLVSASRFSTAIGGGFDAAARPR